MATPIESQITVVKTDVKTFVLSHLIWVVAIAVALVLGNITLKEHDARVVAEASIKVSQANIAALQQQITDRDAQLAQKVTVITKVVHDLGPAPTTGQIVAAVPQLTQVPLNARTIPGDAVNISVAAFPLVQVLQQAAIDHAANLTCQGDLTDQKAISAQKDTQIAALRKKPKFLDRVKHVAEAVAAGIAIGVLLR